MGRRWSLAGQLLALQLVIVSLVLVAVAAVSLTQSSARFTETAGRRAQAIAETVAATGPLRAALEQRPTATVDAESENDGSGTTLVRSIAESARSVSGSSSVLVADVDGTVLASAVPAELGTTLELPGSVLSSGRSWVGEVSSDAGTRIVAQVPVQSDAPGRVGAVVGVVAVSRDKPTLWDDIGAAVPNLLVYLGVASLLGVVGSLLVARRVKRQTLGLEPLEITGLVEHRDATLHGIKEGMVAVDLDGRVTLANDMARTLLRLPSDPVGRDVRDLGLDVAVSGAFVGDGPATDVTVAVQDKVLVLNRMPIRSRGRRIGSVTTLRDRTELMALQRELDAVHDVTQTLRAQAHEFSNRMHTISGLIELGEYDEVVRYVDRISRSDARLAQEVTSRITDPAVAALLVAKASLATEQGVELRIAATCRLEPVDAELSADVVTVLGNLVDNAVDAASGQLAGERWVDVEVVQDDEQVTVSVADSGPGVAAEVAAELFERGVTTKPVAGGGRGIGLSLVRLVCTRRGGNVDVHHDGRTVFTASLPVAVQAVST